MRPTTSLGRSILGHRDQQVHSMDGHDTPDSDPTTSFDRHVSSLIHSLLADVTTTTSSFLSIPWLIKLLDSLHHLLDSFSSLKLPNCPSLNRLLSDFSDRSVKSLDLLNSTGTGLDRVQHVRVQIEIAISALRFKNLHRAHKALAKLINPAQPGPNRTAHRLRSLPIPAGAPVFALTSFIVFVSWAVAVSFPAHDCVLHGVPAVPRSYIWAGPMVILQDMILEEAKKRKSENGLISKIGRIGIERMGLEMVRELEEVRDTLQGLEEFEKKVREVFHRIIRCRMEVLESIRARS